MNTPYEIANAANLLWLSDPVNDTEWGKDFLQTADIDMAGCTWVPIAQAPLWQQGNLAFTGSYDGAGYSIDNLVLSDPNSVGYVGLFGNVDGAAIINLELDVSFTPGQGYSGWSIGGLIGMADQTSSRPVTIQDVSLMVDLDLSSSTSQNVGGLIGELPGNGIIANVLVSGSVTAFGGVGGLIGTAYSYQAAQESLDIRNVESHVVSIATDEGAGGLVGYTTHENLSISGVVVSEAGSVSSPQFSGGIIGRLIESCSSGQPCRSANVSISDAEVVAPVVSVGGHAVGGAVGEVTGGPDLEVTRVRILGGVRGRESVGGLIGSSQEYLHSGVTYVSTITVVDSLVESQVFASHASAGCLFGDLDPAADAAATVSGSYSQSTATDPSGTTLCQHLPGSPTGVSAEGDGGVASVSWSAPIVVGEPALTTYTVTASPGGATCSAVAPAVSCDVSGLTVGTLYTFVVAATNSIGTGPSGQSNSFAMVATPTTTSTTVAAPSTSTTVAPTTTLAVSPTQALVVVTDSELPAVDVVSGATEADLGVPGTVVAGQTVTATGTGFTPEEGVVAFLASTRSIAATSKVSSAGVATASLMIPVDASGEQTIVMWEPASDRLLAQTVTVEGAVLPATGGSFPVAPVMVLLLAAGAVLVVTARRRSVV